MNDTNPPNDSPGTEGPTRAEGSRADGPSTLPAEELSEVVRQRDEYLDQLQRARAEFANYQKRAKAQADIDRTYAVGKLASDLLNVIDNFERALEAAKASGASSIVDGLELVHRQLLEALAKNGVEPIAAQGQTFDPAVHEAITQMPSAEHPEGTVARDLGRGYKLHDRVLRPSRVAVSTGPPSGQG